jgi:small subunit ribosomal protein S11
MDELKKVKIKKVVGRRLSKVQLLLRRGLRRRKKRYDSNSTLVCNFRTTKNNFFITFYNRFGLVLVKGSGGLFFHGSQRNTPYAVKFLIKHCVHTLYEKSIKSRYVILEINSPLNNLLVKNFVKGFRRSGLFIIRIRDITGVAHNGCKGIKKRRV